MRSLSIRFNNILICSVCLFLAISFTFINSFADSFLLLPEEASQLQLSETEWGELPIVTRGSTSGPIIDFKQPAVTDPSNPTLETVSPLSLIILFQQNNAPVDMGSLEIVAKKGFFKKNLTERVKPYVQGTTLQATDLAVPSGRFKIQIIIADIKGNQTSVEYRLQVED